MPQTPFLHFEEDLERSEDLVDHAANMVATTDRQRRCRDDILRAGWMMAIGALDAYFCDVVVDVLSKTIRAKELQSDVRLGKKVEALDLPIGAYFSPYAIRKNWRWRMAARKLMQRDNILSLGEAKKRINPFLDNQLKLLDSSHIESMLQNRSANNRLFGVPRGTFVTLRGSAKQNAIKTARKTLKERFKQLIQRRHDCIHNCDRPEIALHRIEAGTVGNVLKDVRFVVTSANNRIDEGFKVTMQHAGCSVRTLNAIGCS